MSLIKTIGNIECLFFIGFCEVVKFITKFIYIGIDEAQKTFKKMVIK